MSRRLVVSAYSSLDGVVEDPVGMENSGLGNWVGPFTRGPEGDRIMHEELMASDMLLLGRKTYEGFAPVWPTVQDETGFADKINSMPKYVASRTMLEATWTNTMVLSEDVPSAVMTLKEGGGGDILIYGSARLVHGLLPAGLVDVIHLMVYPVVLGTGVRLLPDGWSSRLDLELVSKLGTGIVSLRYQVRSD